MVIAVPPEHLPAVQQRCDRVGVGLADVGTFTGDGRLVVRHRDMSCSISTPSSCTTDVRSVA